MMEVPGTTWEVPDAGTEQPASVHPGPRTSRVSMARSQSMTAARFRFALADSISFLNPDHWDRVVARSGLFLSRSFLQLLESHLPGNLSVHYAIVYAGDRPVAAVVAQSLEIRVADLSSASLPKVAPDFWHSLGKASQRSISQARKRFLLYDNPSLWPYREEAGLPGAQGESWPGLASDIWQRLRHLLKGAERVAELPVAWARLRFLVCGNLLSTGPHGVAFADERESADLWPAVVEALYRMRKSSTLFGESDMVMIKDLTDEQAGVGAILGRLAFRRFETEPNMVLPLKPSWATFTDCLNDMKSDYRSRIRKTLKELADAGIVLESIGPERVEAEAAEIHGLYHQVHDRRKLRLVTIRKGWIPALAGHYRDDFRTVVARRTKGGKILGFITLIRDGDGALRILRRLRQGRGGKRPSSLRVPRVRVRGTGDRNGGVARRTRPHRPGAEGADRRKGPEDVRLCSPSEPEPEPRGPERPGPSFPHRRRHRSAIPSRREEPGSCTSRRVGPVLGMRPWA